MLSATHLHAMVIHFPIALLMVGFLFETIGLFSKKTFFSQAGFYLLILAAAGAITAYLTGNAAGEGMEGGSFGKAIEAHEQAATITLWLTVGTALLRSAYEMIKNKMQWLKIISFVLFTSAVAGVSYTGYLGGQLVFNHAAGVELTIGGSDSDQSED